MVPSMLRKLHVKGVVRIVGESVKLICVRECMARCLGMGVRAKERDSEWVWCSVTPPTRY
jgi:hypothetical protein